MELTEYPLLHTQDLMVTLLRVGAERAATIEDGVARLREMLRLAHEDPPVSDHEIGDHLTRAKFRLMEARLLEPVDAGRFRTTARGHQVLVEHPTGVDESVLVGFAEYRQYVAQAGQCREEPPAREGAARRSGPAGIAEYEEGFAAFRQGKTLADNPYDWDVDKHLAWENGWSESRDAELRGQQWREAKAVRRAASA